MSRCEAAAVELLEDRRLLSATGAEETDAAIEETDGISADESGANDGDDGYEGDYEAEVYEEEFYSEQYVGTESGGDSDGYDDYYGENEEVSEAAPQSAEETAYRAAIDAVNARYSDAVTAAWEGYDVALLEADLEFYFNYLDAAEAYDTAAEAAEDDYERALDVADAAYLDAEATAADALTRAADAIEAEWESDARAAWEDYDGAHEAAVDAYDGAVDPAYEEYQETTRAAYEDYSEYEESSAPYDGLTYEDPDVDDGVSYGAYLDAIDARIDAAWDEYVRIEQTAWEQYEPIEREAALTYYVDAVLAVLDRDADLAAAEAKAEAAWAEKWDDYVEDVAEALDDWDTAAGFATEDYDDTIYKAELDYVGRMAGAADRWLEVESTAKQVAERLSAEAAWDWLVDVWQAETAYQEGVSDPYSGVQMTGTGSGGSVTTVGLAASVLTPLAAMQAPPANPIGRVVTFTGEEEDVNRANQWFTEMYNRAPAEFREYLDGIAERGTLTVRVVSDNRLVFLGRYDVQAIDVGDIEHLPDEGMRNGLTKDWVMLWEIIEQDLKQNQGGKGRLHSSAHKQAIAELDDLYREAFGEEAMFSRPGDSTTMPNTRKGIPVKGEGTIYFNFGFDYSETTGRYNSADIHSYVIMNPSTREVIRVQNVSPNE